MSFLTTELFMAVAGGLKITHVPYKGTGPALAALLAGETELFFDNLGTSLPHVRSGRLKALAVCGERRHAALPDVRRRLGELSAETIRMTPAEMGRFMKQETERWRNAIRTAGVKQGEL